MRRLNEPADWYGIERQLISEYCIYNVHGYEHDTDDEAYKLVMNLRGMVSYLSKLRVGNRPSTKYKEELIKFNEHLEYLEQILLMRVLQRI